MQAMIENRLLWRWGYEAAEAGDHDRARAIHERSIALGDAQAWFSLGCLYDMGPKPDPAEAMRCYQRCWRAGFPIAANNIAILYREAGDRRRMAQWFRRAAESGQDHDAALQLARCYLDGTGVRRSLPQAVRWLAVAASAPEDAITDDGREEARRLLAAHRPHAVAVAGPLE
ncbi:MAG: sel1 repeat family protein [Caulobacteraceae bacterium]|nr:sel1 repeat family protein [Caulobacteraceae bacterium]